MPPKAVPKVRTNYLLQSIAGPKDSRTMPFSFYNYNNKHPEAKSDMRRSETVGAYSQSSEINSGHSSRSDSDYSISSDSGMSDSTYSQSSEIIGKMRSLIQNFK